MPYKKKKGIAHKKIILIAAIVMTTLVLIASGIFAYLTYQKDQAAKAAAALDALPRIVVPEGHFKLMEFAPTEMPKNKKTITVRPKIDIYTDIKADQATLEAEVDKLIADIKSLAFNGIILDTRLDDSVVFASNRLASTPVDLLSIIIAKAAENDLSVSVIYHLTGLKNTAGEPIDSFLNYENRQALSDGLSELAVYEVESLMLDSYYTKKNGLSFAEYQSYGSADEYLGWLKDNVNVIVDRMVTQAKQVKDTLPIGLCVSSVWANAETAEGGSATKAKFEALTNGYADTKTLVESGLLDFINVKISTAIGDTEVGYNTALNWWGGVCLKSKVPMYITHSGEYATSKELPAWNRTDELARQALFAMKLPSYYGSSFTGPAELLADPGGSTEYLKKQFAGQVDEKDVLKDLKVTAPTKSSFVTYEENYQFKMTFDPNAEVFLNGKQVEVSSRGGASVWVPLKVGKNHFKLEHKGQVQNYTIERKVIIFKEVSPTKAMKVAGSSTIEVTALAYRGSNISATINGKNIQMTEGGGGEENDAESIYRIFTGSYTVPKATAKEQAIGSITFNGNYQGEKQSAKGAAITIEKLADEVDPDEATGQNFVHAIVNKRYANVYPYKTTGYPQAIEYQLPKGTQDIVVSQSGDYLNLRSGKTIMRQAVTLEDIAFVGNNPISNMTVGVEGNSTVVRMSTAWKSPISINLSPYANYTTRMGKQDYYFRANSVTILLDYGTTLQAENYSGDVSNSPIFSGISHKRVKNEARGIWQYQITLPLRQEGRYYGAHAEWEGDTLVIRFNHPPTSNGSLSGIKIAVDPGHGGKDPGNRAGRDSIEKELNLEYSFRLQAALQAAGAQVYMIRENDDYISTESRVDMAEANGCNLYISVHQNSSSNNFNAYGVQTYYNAPFSQPLAQYVQASLQSVAPSSKWNYWNGSQTSYNFVVTRERQFPSILIECGFLSNYEDEARALDPSYQESMVQAMVQGIINYYSAYN